MINKVLVKKATRAIMMAQESAMLKTRVPSGLRNSNLRTLAFLLMSLKKSVILLRIESLEYFIMSIV